jgi:hypothetical protein
LILEEEPDTFRGLVERHRGSSSLLSASARFVSG